MAEIVVRDSFQQFYVISVAIDEVDLHIHNLDKSLQVTTPGAREWGGVVYTRTFRCWSLFFHAFSWKCLPTPLGITKTSVTNDVRRDPPAAACFLHEVGLIVSGARLVKFMVTTGQLSEPKALLSVN